MSQKQLDDTSSEEDFTQITRFNRLIEEKRAETEQRMAAFHDVLLSKGYLDTPEFEEMVISRCPKARACGYAPSGNRVGYLGGDIDFAELPEEVVALFCKKFNIDGVMVVAARWLTQPEIRVRLYNSAGQQVYYFYTEINPQMVMLKIEDRELAACAAMYDFAMDQVVAEYSELRTVTTDQEVPAITSAEPPAAKPTADPTEAPATEPVKKTTTTPTETPETEPEITTSAESAETPAPEISN
ncbi:MAG: hypothetical protein QNJ97_11175 [Myxococcota bacterium]|nr:hypothetical protein [Myxococcota bacterium]